MARARFCGNDEPFLSFVTASQDNDRTNAIGPLTGMGEDDKHNGCWLSGREDGKKTKAKACKPLLRKSLAGQHMTDVALGIRRLFPLVDIHRPAKSGACGNVMQHACWESRSTVTVRRETCKSVCMGNGDGSRELPFFHHYQWIIFRKIGACPGQNPVWEAPAAEVFVDFADILYTSFPGYISGPVFIVCVFMFQIHACFLHIRCCLRRSIRTVKQGF